MFYVLLFGELWFQVPHSVKVILDGRQPNYPIAKDIILALAGHTATISRRACPSNIAARWFPS